MQKRQRLVDEYLYPGFRPLSTIRNHPVDPDARIIVLRRRQKKQCAAVAEKFIIRSMIERLGLSETSPAVLVEYILKWKSVEFYVRSVAR